MTPAISVVMPLHNRAAVVGRAIESVLAQSLADFELIIVDDGSTDDGVSIACGFDDPRVRVIELGRNLGANTARNAGVREAKAPLIAFLDSDDAYLPNKLARTVEQFASRPSLDLLVDSFVKVQPPGSTPPKVARRNPVIDDRETFRRALFTRRLWKATPSITVRRDAIVRAGLFDESLRRLQDFDFLIRVSEFANCASIDELLWVKYWDAGAISAQDSMIPANIELCRRHPEFLGNPAYRPGLAHALRLSLWRRAKSGDLRGAVRDIGDLRRAFGWGQAGRLLLGAARRRPALRG
jgi:glycosyltransferase involved in cell wall biosynthesis